MDRAELRVAVRHEDSGTVIDIAGELDMSNADHLSAAVTAELDKGPERVVLDLAELTFCDSLGLRTLLLLSRNAQAQQTFLALRNPSPFFTRMLQITGVESALNITD
jgi:anti-anti-sigma factor